MTDLKEQIGHGANSEFAPPKEQKSAKKEQANSQAILDFINSCVAYELDAIRIIAKYATDKAKPEAISDDDKAYVVKYLNSGIDKSKDRNADQVVAARRKMLKQLLSKADRFCQKDDLIRVISAATDIAIDSAEVKKIVDDISRGAFQN
jgi:small-conductance mechanosensitive channel